MCLHKNFAIFLLINKFPFFYSGFVCLFVFFLSFMICQIVVSIRINGNSRAFTQLIKSRNASHTRFNCKDVYFTTETERFVVVPFLLRMTKYSFSHVEHCPNGVLRLWGNVWIEISISPKRRACCTHTLWMAGTKKKCQMYNVRFRWMKYKCSKPSICSVSLPSEGENCTFAVWARLRIVETFSKGDSHQSQFSSHRWNIIFIGYNCSSCAIYDSKMRKISLQS